jgi:hypothetical protein
VRDAVVKPADKVLVGQDIAAGSALSVTVSDARRLLKDAYYADVTPDGRPRRLLLLEDIGAPLTVASLLTRQRDGDLQKGLAADLEDSLSSRILDAQLEDDVYVAFTALTPLGMRTSGLKGGGDAYRQSIAKCFLRNEKIYTVKFVVDYIHVLQLTCFCTALGHISEA